MSKKETAISLDIDLWFGNNRFAKRVYRMNSQSTTYDLEKTVHFLYDGWSMIFEKAHSTSSGQTNVRTFVWGLDLSGSLQGAGGVGGLLSSSYSSSLSSQSSTGATADFYYTCDGNGNVSEVLSAENGSIAAAYGYSPFGALIRENYSSTISHSPLAISHFKFSSKYQDTETNLYDYGYRYYDAEMGRWLSRDPIGELSYRLKLLFGAVGDNSGSGLKRMILNRNVFSICRSDLWIICLKTLI